MTTQKRIRRKPVRWINERNEGIYTMHCSNNKYTKGRKVDPYERSSGYEHNSWFHIERDNTFSGKIEDKAYLDDKENEWKEDDEDWIVHSSDEASCSDDDEWVMEEGESEWESEEDEETLVESEKEEYQVSYSRKPNQTNKQNKLNKPHEGYVLYLIRKIVCYRKN